MSKATTAKTQANRLPAPSLFVGPPSRNASNLDLPRSPTKDSINFKTTPSAAIPGPASPNSPTDTKDPLDARDDPGDSQPEGAAQFRRGRRGTAVLDAHWAALQSTLGDIELSASSSAHVFGPAHAAALEELRRAQVELARAWGPEGADGDYSGEDGEGTERRNTVTSGKQTIASGKGAEKKGEAGKSEEEKDMDLAARRRREGDRYFAKVKTGVQDVVLKLEAVTQAMRAVEMESREIWGESDSTTDLSESIAS
ncbi:hypothetical protein MBLNU459_g2527t1 [Dothideomycetes sp. NU459]